MSDIVAIKSTIEAHTDYACYADVPSDRPDEFVTVEVTGGTVSAHGLLESTSYALQCWAKSTFRADSMASEVMDALNGHLTDEHDDIARCNCPPGYSWPTSDGVPRYQSNLEVVRKRG